MALLSHNSRHSVKRSRHGRAFQAPHISEDPFKRRRRRGNFAGRITATEFALSRTVARMLARSNVR